jgi:hypothetical protein
LLSFCFPNKLDLEQKSPNFKASTVIFLIAQQQREETGVRSEIHQISTFGGKSYPNLT